MRLFRLTITIITLVLLSLATPVFSLELTGKAALLMDASSGRVFLEHNCTEQLPVASISKLMTLTIILEAVERGDIGLGESVTASAWAASKRGTRIWLEEDEQLTLNELLYAVAVGSANDAAVAVAEHLAGNEQDFVQLMNKRARELGLTKTQFVNCTGLPEEDNHNLMSAQDVATLARHALEVPLMMDYVSTYEHTMRSTSTKIPVLWNANKLLRRYYGVDGFKTGFTSEAGYCIAATAVREHLRLIAISLGHKNEEERESETRALLDLGFRKYHALQLYSKGSVLSSVICPSGQPRTVDAVLVEDCYVTVERGKEMDLTTVINLEPNLLAPLEKGAVVGQLNILYQEQLVGSGLLTISESVKKASLPLLLLRMGQALAQAI